MPRERKAERSKTELDMDENLEGALCYIGFFATGLLFLLLERKSKFVRFHALQSTVTFIGLLVIYAIFNLLFFWAPSLFIQIVNAFILLVALIIWLVLIIRANQGEWYKLPIAGDFAEKEFKEKKK